jgi:hypothetical protein
MISPTKDGTTYLVGDVEVTYYSDLGEWLVVRGDEGCWAPNIAITAGGAVLDFMWDEVPDTTGVDTTWRSWDDTPNP